MRISAEHQFLINGKKLPVQHLGRASNAIITPDIMERDRVVITSEKFLLLEGVLQNQDGVVSVRVERVAPLREAYSTDVVDITDAEVKSHDFH